MVLTAGQTEIHGKEFDGGSLIIDNTMRKVEQHKCQNRRTTLDVFGSRSLNINRISSEALEY